MSRQRWRTILVLALVVAGGAFLTGQSATAVRTRRSLAAGLGRLRGGAEHAGLRTGPVGTWVYANKQLLRIAAVTLAALALVLWGQPTGKTILVLTGLLLVALAIIEFLSQPPQHTTVAPNPDLNPAPAPRAPSASTLDVLRRLVRALASGGVEPDGMTSRMTGAALQPLPARRPSPL